MKIKFGKFELQDWSHSLLFGCGPNNVTVESWYRKSYDLDKESASVYLYVTKDFNTWNVKYWNAIDFLNKFTNPQVIGTLEEATNYIDNFIVKMNRYSTFF